MMNEANNGAPKMNNETKTFKSFYILAALITRLASEVATLNKRAAKLGLDPIEMVVTDDYIQVVKTREKKFRVDLRAHEIVINGWKVAGVITNLDNGASMLTGDVPEHYRARGTVCEHCGQNRARKVTVLLRNLESGELKQVGRSCLKDFVDHTNPEALADYWDDINSIEVDEDEDGFEDEDGGGFGRGGSYYETLRVLSLAVAVIRVEGRYVPAAVDYEQRSMPTAGIVREVLSGFIARDRFPITAEDEARAAVVLDWGRSKAADGGYLGNVAAALAGGLVQSKTLGIAVSAVAAYARTERDAAEAKRRAESPSRHFGTVGKRETFTFKPVFRTVIEGFYGYKTILVFVDNNGNKATWFASGIVDSPEPNAEGFVTCKATVKEHGEYKGEPQTILSRVKF